MYLLSAKHGQYITILTDSPGLATQGSLPGLVMYGAVAVRGCAIHDSTKACLRASHSPKNLVKHVMNQSFSKVALIGSMPPTQINKECVAGLALPRQTGNTLFYSFLGAGRGRGKRRL